MKCDLTEDRFWPKSAGRCLAGFDPKQTQLSSTDLHRSRLAYFVFPSTPSTQARIGSA